MQNPRRPDLSRLQEVLRQSKATTASGQAALNDPEGYALKEKYQDILEQALSKRLWDVAEKAAAHLDNLNQKEEALREAHHISDAAERHGIEVILDVFDKYDDKGER
jgi:hypothetical protein